MRAIRPSDKNFHLPYERRIGGRQGSLVEKQWMRSGGVVVEMPVALSAEDVTVREESLCSDQITFSIWLPKVVLAMTVQTDTRFGLSSRAQPSAHPTACCLYLTRRSATLDATLQMRVPPWLGPSLWTHVPSVDSPSRHLDVGGPFFVVQP